MSEPVAFLNGRIIPVSEARLHVFDLGVVAGASLTEQVRTFRHVPFRLPQHIARLQCSLRSCARELPIDASELESIARQVVEQNARLIRSEQELGLVLFVTLGQNLSYLGAANAAAARAMSVCVHTFPLSLELWSKKLEQGQHLVTPGMRQIPSDCLDPRIKSRNRLHWMLADQQARRGDPDAVALLLNHEGDITETSTANVFVVREGVIATPPHGAALDGVSQSVVAELAANAGVRFAARRLQIHDALNADEVFTSSTPYCLLPVTRINVVAIGTGHPGPMFQRLLEEWSRLVDVDIAGQIRQASGPSA